MKKIISVIEWGAIIYIIGVLAASVPNMVLDGNLDQYPPLLVSFQTIKPFVYRVLVPLLARGLMAVFDLSAGAAVGIVVFVSGIAAYRIMQKFFSLYKAEFYTPFVFLMTISMLMYRIKVYDFMSVFLFFLAFYLLAVRRFDLYYMIFPVIVLHRETAVLLILLYIFYRSNLMGMVYQLATFAILRSLLIMTFADSPGVAVPLLLGDVMGVYLQTPAVWIAAVLLALAGIIIASHWSYYDGFLKCALLLFPIQIIFHLLVGYPFEVRVMAESFPIFWLMFSMGLQGLFHRSVFPALHHSKE